MSSCSTSSNIASLINSLSLVQGGARLEAQIPFVSGLTVGNVIRYDVPTSGYTASRANGPAESEVFGVIESYNSSSNTFTVVTYGSINISASNLTSIDGTGGSGGNDIYFLSGLTAGRLQNLAPDNFTHIVKPVYQVAPHSNGAYSGVIVNYLGYRVGGEIEAVLEDRELGNIQIVVGLGSGEFENGYVDATVPNRLRITDYPEFYAKFGTAYGYVEKIVVQETVATNIIGSNVTQNGSNIGTIVDIGSPNTLYVSRPSDAQLVSLSQVKVNIANNNILTYNVTSREIYEVYTPIVSYSDNQPIVTASNTDGTQNETTYIGIKVKPQGVAVTLPNTIASMKVTQLLLGNSAIDVESKINNFETRIAKIEAKLGL